MLPIQQITLPTPWPAVGPVHVYLVRQDPITLIDTGLNTPDSREALEQGLRDHGLSVKDIRRVLLTHAHLDHMGLAAWIQDQSGAEVWLHPDEAGKADTPDWWHTGREISLVQAGVPLQIRELMERFWQQGRKLSLPLHGGWTPLAPGQRFEFDRGGVLEAVHLPGHALGHTGFYDPETARLVGGDHLLLGVTPNPIMEPVPPLEGGHPATVPHAPIRALTLGQFLAALEQVMALPVRQVLPGHGEVIDDHRTVGAGYLARHERRLATMRDRILQGRTAYEVTREAYPKVREWDVFLALSEVLAHLDLLVVRGQASVEAGPDGLIYQAQ